MIAENYSQIADNNNVVESGANDTGIEQQATHESLMIEDAIRLGDTITPFEYTPGAKKGSVLVYTTDEKQLYVKNKTNKKGDVFWTCRTKPCAARVKITSSEVCSFASSYSGHSHQPCEELQTGL